MWRDTQYQDSVKNDFIMLFDRLFILDKCLRKTNGFNLEELDSVEDTILIFLVKISFDDKCD